MQWKSKKCDGIDELKCEKCALNMSGFAVELAPMQPSKDAARSQNLPPSSQPTAYLPPPDLITPFKQSLSQRRAESDSRLSVSGIAPMRRSTVHAQPAVQPPKTLVHHLAHIRYLPPEKSIASLTGIRQHIAHYLHLYRTGLCETPVHSSQTDFPV